ncbi:uncharacterized protein PGTG_18483 [Puccinia graminis f. sp. tritici CRL 75-36-700-3]|uniref:Uncharacterized protein n=1 Tax=Puccinia graminis f. sp. tritici (strain CRL 75-36-700-3 / race SCCL) TaxID=418459 RepID=E3L6U3_PUCGT|nr:uncharacterized protein PGTG_18483 [Puccinia graminis f. sp. tritici CRL 75-36-700-3]EFP92268.2 hypothetical protein PGTG_18483 [Puccinia graminis f. sp. tritici CRL 75-36-700-3]
MPVQNDPNFFRPSKNSSKALPPSSTIQTTSKQTRKRPQRPSSASALTSTHAARKPKKTKVSQKLKKHKSKRVVESSKGSESESSTDNEKSSSQSNTERHGTARMIEFTQDSDNANCQFKLHKKKAKAKDGEFDDVEDYFHPPVFEEGKVLELGQTSSNIKMAMQTENRAPDEAGQFQLGPYTRKWAATEAHRLYCHLQSKVLDSLQSNTSKLSLIHDVWTTRGNWSAFLGITVAYIDDSWNFKVSHLLVKYIAWMHKAKYLVIPLANILLKLLKKDSNHNNDISIAKNHIRCFCQKLALILNAGLKLILVPQRTQIPTSTMLGFVPGLCAITKKSSKSGQVGPMANPFDQEGFVDDSDSNHSENKGPAVREANVQQRYFSPV